MDYREMVKADSAVILLNTPRSAHQNAAAGRPCRKINIELKTPVQSLHPRPADCATAKIYAAPEFDGEMAARAKEVADKVRLNSLPCVQ
jgi:hypothetical protein